MRFMEYPLSTQLGTKTHYMVRLKNDAGLQTLADRLGFEVYDEKKIEQESQKIDSQKLEPDSLLSPLKESDRKKSGRRLCNIVL